MKILYILHKIKDGFSWYFLNTIVANLPSIYLRYYFLKVFGMTLAENVRFYQGFHVRNPKGIEIEDGVSIGPKVLLDGRMGLKIGKNAVIAYEAIIWSLNHDYNDINFKAKGAPVEIGEYAWICSRSIILPGIKVGKGAVVAAGAVVTKNVPSYAVVAGMPAKIIGYRKEIDYQYGYNKKIVEFIS